MPLLGEIRNLDLTGVELAIVGSERGENAREMKPEWAIDIINKCKSSEVAVMLQEELYERDEDGDIVEVQNYPEMPRAFWKWYLDILEPYLGKNYATLGMGD